MATYEQVLGGQVNLGNVNWGAQNPNAGTLGQQILALCAGLNPAVHADMQQITHHFFNSVQLAGFQWSPTTPGNSYIAGARLLEGTAAAGECAYVANGLALLINAPNPWGLGAGGAVVRSYSGQNNVGFLSNHVGAIPGVQLNVTRPNGLPLNAVHLWDNHKVVEVNNRFYDACYDRDYVALANMAATQLQLTRGQVRLRDLVDYNHKSPASFAALMGLKVSDAFWSNTHTIDVYQGIGGATAGYYVCWGQDWKDWTWTRHIKSEWYGPYLANPLAR